MSAETSGSVNHGDKESAVSRHPGGSDAVVVRATIVAGLACGLWGACGQEVKHLGTDVMDPAGLLGLPPSTAVALDGSTYVAEPFQGSVDIDPLGAGDQRTSSSDGPATVPWRTRPGGDRVWVKVLDDGGASSIAVSPRSSNGSVIVVGHT